MEDIVRRLPGYNCGECGFKNCREFASALLQDSDLDLGLCSFMSQERYQGAKKEIEELLPAVKGNAEEIRGVIDGLAADFALAPLLGEPSCREELHPFDGSIKVELGDVLRYRPWGCPITHFGRVIKVEGGLVTVHMVGPCHLLGDESFAYKEAGLCIVVAFEGTVSRGRICEVGETVRFLPDHCMMQKVHSGVIVHSEGKMVRIEGIDLKVW